MRTGNVEDVREFVINERFWRIVLCGNVVTPRFRHARKGGRTSTPTNSAVTLRTPNARRADTRTEPTSEQKRYERRDEQQEAAGNDKRKPAEECYHRITLGRLTEGFYDTAMNEASDA
jgi:hypothetical protein